VSHAFSRAAQCSRQIRSAGTDGDSRAGVGGIVAVVVAALLALAAHHRFVDAVTVPTAWRSFSDVDDHQRGT
jgi:hypothetical protein